MLQRRPEPDYFITEPSHSCPFRTEAIRFVPLESYEDGLTLLLFHAMNMHKETFTPLVDEFFKIVSTGSVRIREVWAIDNPNQGRSGNLNRELLESEKYRDEWSATEYANAAYALLSSTAQGIDFSRRKLVGVAHSGGSTGLMTLQMTHPEIPFQGLIFMDPGILPPHKPSSQKLAGLFRKTALAKRDTWANIEEARKDLSQKAAYRNFTSEAFDSFLKCGLRTVGDHSSAVTLACSKLQEGAYYASKDMLVPPAEGLIKLSQDDTLPVHLIVCLNDEYKGLSDDMKAFQIETIGKMSCGSVQVIEKGGHMFPQVEPALTACHLRIALMRIWTRGARL